MQQLDYNCRYCETTTKQEVRVVTFNLPSYVKTIQCLSCGMMNIAFMADK